MFQLIVLATVLTACVADDREAQQTASPQILIHNDYHRQESQRLRQNLERLRHELNIPKYPNVNGHGLTPERYDDRRAEYDDHRDMEHDEWQHRVKQERQWWTDKDKIEHVDDNEDVLPVILRTIKSHDTHHHPDIARQNKIVEDVYSPDYAQPTWTIDYRYLKSGGRDYTRGPGGQIIILPAGIRTNEKKDFRNYDELIENLRQKHLQERSKPQYFMPLGQEIHHSDAKWYN